MNIYFIIIHLVILYFHISLIQEHFLSIFSVLTDIIFINTRELRL